MSSTSMTRGLFFLLLVTLTLALLIPAATPRGILHGTAEDAVVLQRFDAWMLEYGRRYSTEEEKAIRFAIFKDNLRYIEAFNRNGSHSFKLGINPYSDLTIEEFNKRMVGKEVPEPEPTTVGSFRYENATAPQSKDWRDDRCVSNVRHQGYSCGACWAFAAASAVESIHCIRYGDLDVLSVQQMLDCIPGDGCEGGNAWSAFGYIANKGLNLDEDWPYVETDTDTCSNRTKEEDYWTSIKGFERVPSYSEDDLLLAVANQPVYAVIGAGSTEFAYLTGDQVFEGYCGTEDHAVLVVGYGTQPDGKDFWLVKNSWGPYWGDHGYVKLRRGSGKGLMGICGITRRATYPTVD